MIGLLDSVEMSSRRTYRFISWNTYCVSESQLERAVVIKSRDIVIHGKDRTEGDKTFSLDCTVGRRWSSDKYPTRLRLSYTRQSGFGLWETCESHSTCQNVNQIYWHKAGRHPYNRLATSCLRDCYLFFARKQLTIFLPAYPLAVFCHLWQHLVERSQSNGPHRTHGRDMQPDVIFGYVCACDGVDMQEVKKGCVLDVVLRP